MTAAKDSERAASARGWWAALLWRRPRLLARLASLAARRGPRRRAAAAMVGAALLLSGLSAPGRSAGPIQVVDGRVEVAADGQCSLIEAIDNANDAVDGRPHADCAPGDPAGPDTVVLPAGGRFTLGAPLNQSYGQTGLPLIGTAVTIEGNGATIRRDTSAAPFRLLAVAASGDLTLRDVVVEGGYVSEAYGEPFGAGRGAGIYSHGSLTLEGGVFRLNRARNGGGAVFSIDGTLAARDTAFVANTAFRGGAALHVYQGEATLEGATFTANRYQPAVYNQGTVALVDCAIEGNGDAGVRNHGSLTISGGTIRNNNGRGVTNEETATLTGVWIAGNRRGGIETRGDMVLTASTVSGNRGWSGAGVSSDGETTIVNSTISDNVAAVEGGGLYVGKGVTTVYNSTVSGNAAATGGGAFVYSFSNDNYLYFCYEGELRLHGTIVSGNAATAGREVYSEVYSAGCAGRVSSDHTLFGHSGSPGVVNVVPGGGSKVPAVAPAAILGPLQWNGGPTPTHDLPPGSPALDAVPSAQCAAAPVSGRDQRGWARGQDGDGNSTAAECDMGAVEWQPWPVAAYLAVVAR